MLPRRLQHQTQSCSKDANGQGELEGPQLQLERRVDQDGPECSLIVNHGDCRHSPPVEKQDQSPSCNWLCVRVHYLCGVGMQVCLCVSGSACDL